MCASLSLELSQNFESDKSFDCTFTKLHKLFEQAARQARRIKYGKEFNDASSIPASKYMADDKNFRKWVAGLRMRLIRIWLKIGTEKGVEYTEWTGLFETGRCTPALPRSMQAGVGAAQAGASLPI